MKWMGVSKWGITWSLCTPIETWLPVPTRQVHSPRQFQQALLLTLSPVPNSNNVRNVTNFFFTRKYFIQQRSSKYWWPCTIEVTEKEKCRHGCHNPGHAHSHVPHGACVLSYFFFNCEVFIHEYTIAKYFIHEIYTLYNTLQCLNCCSKEKAKSFYSLEKVFP